MFKEFQERGHRMNSWEHYLESMEVQTIAGFFANCFNEAVKSISGIKKITFLKSRVVLNTKTKVIDGKNVKTKRYCAMEQFIQGE